MRYSSLVLIAVISCVSCSNEFDKNNSVNTNPREILTGRPFPTLDSFNSKDSLFDKSFILGYELMLSQNYLWDSVNIDVIENINSFDSVLLYNQLFYTNLVNINLFLIAYESDKNNNAILAGLIYNYSNLITNSYMIDTLLTNFYSTKIDSIFKERSLMMHELICLFMPFVPEECIEDEAIQLALKFSKIDCNSKNK